MLPNADYKISYRRGYYADRPKTRQAAESSAEDPLIPLVGFGMPNFDQINYKVQAAPVQPQPAPDARRAGLNAEMEGPFTRYGVDVVVSVQGCAWKPLRTACGMGALRPCLSLTTGTAKLSIY